MGSKRIKGITIEIDGNTTPLTKSLANANKTLSKTQAELRDVNKLLKLDPNNTTLLAQKQNLLKDAIGSAKEKLDQEKKALEQLKSAGNTEKTQEQQRALEREIIDTENQLEKFQKEARETGRALDSMNDEVKETDTDLGKVQRRKNALKDIGEGAKAAAKALGTVAKYGAMAAATVGTAMTKASVDTSKYADEVLTMSKVTGMSTDDLQAYKYAAELVDVSLETLSGSMRKNVKSMANAQSGSKKYVAAYEKLGVSVTDANGQLRNSEDVYYEAIDALGKIENTTERDAIAMQLFGKSAQDLNPLIEAGTGRLKELKEEAKEMGVVLSSAQLEKAGNFNDQIERLKATAGGAKNAIGTVLIPELTTLATSGTQLLGQFSRGIISANGDLSKIGTAIGDAVAGAFQAVSAQLPRITTVAVGVLSAIVSAVPSIVGGILSIAPQLVSAVGELLVIVGSQLPSLLDQLIVYLPPVIDKLFVTVGELLGKIGELLPVLLPKIIQLAISLANSVIQNLPSLISMIFGTLIPQVIISLTSAFPQVLQGAITLLMAIVSALPQIVTALTDALPDIITSIVDFVTNPTSIMMVLKAALMLLKAIITAVIQTAAALFKVMPRIGQAIAAGISRAWSNVKQAASELWGRVKGFFENVVGGAWKWGSDMLSNFAEGLRSGMDAVINWVKNLAQKIKDFLGFSEPDEGPLSNFHTFAPDMIDLYIQGIKKNMPKLEKAVAGMSAVIATGTQVTPTVNVNVPQSAPTVNQYNTYSAPHSDYEMWQAEQNMKRLIRNTVRGAR